MNKHTPGPWRVSNGHPWNIVDESGQLVASASFARSLNQPTPTEREQVHADARLIATAPELLDIAAVLYKVATEPGYTDTDRGYNLRILIPVLGAALDKAGG